LHFAEYFSCNATKFFVHYTRKVKMSISEDEAKTLRTMIAEWTAAQAKNAEDQAQATARAAAGAAARAAMRQQGWDMLKYGALGLLCLGVGAMMYERLIGRYPAPAILEQAAIATGLISGALLFIGCFWGTQW